MRCADGPLVSAGPPMDAPRVALGTPPGSPPDSPRGSEDGAGDTVDSPPVPHTLSPPRGKLSTSARKYATDTDAATAMASPRDSQSTTSTATVESSANDHHAPRRAKKPYPDDIEDDDDEFHDIALDASVGVVTKSIFKKRSGFLSRLRDASSSMVKTTYAPSEVPNAAIVIPANAPPLPPPPREPTPAFTKEETEHIHRAMRPGNENVEIVLEEEEPIDVAIDQVVGVAAVEMQRETAMAARTNFVGATKRGAFTDIQDDGDDDSGMAPQVVIHSTESDSDSGFATLNPIINRHGQGRRGSTSSAITAGAAVGTSPRVLLSLPIDEEAPTTSNERLVLVINALGATGLAKVEKFGTQSTLLEMRLRETTDELSSGASHLSYLRTSLHKKGGSEAQWNQQFTTGLRSRTKQLLHVAVRTHSKLLVGETIISLANVGDSLYDQHYPIYRTGNDDRRENVGQVHLQLQLMLAAHIAPTNSREQNWSTRRSPGPTPVLLRKGALMFKVPYHTHSLMGAAPTKRQWIAVSGDSPGETLCVTWCDPIDTTEKGRRLDVCLITEIREGAGTKAFERLLQSEPSSVAHERDRCFSIISKSRTLDLVASSKEEARIWIDGLRCMVFGDESQETSASEPSVKTIEEFRYSALVSRDSSTLSMMSTTTKKQQLQQWRSSIFDSARRSDVDFIAACLLDGCPIDMLETGSGDTLLMLACRQGDARLVELCLQWRAKNDPHPEFGETALQVAVNAGHAECLGLILKTAAESEMDAEIVNHIDSNNDAPLHVAARKGDLACMQLLLHHGADICVVEEFGRTPLHCAVLSGSLDCVAYLLDVGGDSVLNAGDHDGDTALHYAALAGADSIVKLLLESAADVQSANVHGETALDLARREKKATCEKLIAQYHQANAPVPALRNEPASSLLLLHQKHEPTDNDEATDAMDYGDEEDDFEDQEPESFIEPSNSPVRRGPIEPVRDIDRDYDDDAEYYVPRSARSSTSSSRSTQPISPSARIRTVLASHRQRTSLHHRPLPVPPLHFHSARDEFHSRYMLEPDYVMPARHAYTERISREQLQYRTHPHPRYPSQEDNYHPYERQRYPYADERGYSHSPMAVRRHSMSPHAYDGLQQYQRDYEDYNEWYGQENHPSVTSRRPGTAEVSPYPRQSEAWHHNYPAPISQPPARTQPPAHRAPAEVWDMYYSDEGYPYYVNRTTGESQWENPYEPTLASPPSSAVQVAPHTNGDSVSAQHHISTDAQMRLQPVAAHETSEAQGGATEASSERVASKALNLLKCPPKTLSIDTSVDNLLEGLPSPSCDSPSSKYEARTGMKLSINVASPQRQDENRPVFVASPRARSPRKTSNGAGTDMNDNSFQKSTRASSPRGKSKNVQIIELKRANNLAMALASFKMNDRNDQIVQALTTLDERVVNAELLVCLQRFFPTDDEAAQLRAYTGPVKSLGPAERFFFQLLQVTDITQRIECFLYKLQFTRNYRSAYSKIQATKRACRDLVENYSFVQALSEFFKKAKQRSLQAFRSDSALFRTEYLSRIDEKLHSFLDDLQKASEIELLDVELQINRLITGSRSVQGFVDKTNPPKDQDVAAHDILHRFLAETRGKLTELEVDYEALGQWEIKVLDLFGESKASCQLTSILECICSMLDKV